MISSMLKKLAGAAFMTVVMSLCPQASAQSYGTPNPATCTQDGKLWYNDGQTLYTHTLGTNTNTLIGSGGIPNSGGGFLQPTITYSYGDIGWGADGNLYAVEFPSDWTNQTKSSGLWVVNSTNGSASRIATINLTEGPINGLSGLPDGRLLFGQLANTQRFVADTSKIWVIRPGTGTLTPTVWATLPSPLPDGSTYAHSSGDMVLIGNTVYAAFVSEKYNAYIYKYQVDSSYNPVGSPSVMAVTLNGTNVGNNGLFGLASYGGKLYTTNNGNAPVYTVDLSSGALTDTGETFTSNQTYGLTAKPEPWGGFCAPTLELKKNIDRGRASSSDQFTVQIQNTSGATLQSATTSGTATTATTGTYVGTAGTTYKLTEIAASGTNLSLYSQAMSCTNATTGSTTALPTTVGGTVTLRLGDVVTCTITNSLRPQLPVTKSYSPATIPSDGVTTSTLTITLGNSTGAAHTLSAALNDNIGAGLEITGVSGGTCDATRTSYSGTTITYAAGATIPNGGCTIRATVRSTTPGSYPNTIPAGALTTTQGGINPAAANATLTVTAPPALTVTKTDSNQTFYQGTTGTYTVTVTNTAPNSTVTGGINVLDALPQGLTLRSVTLASDSPVKGSLSGVSAAGTSGTVGWTFTPSTSMTQGQSAKFVLTVDVGGTTPVGTDSITNYASVGGGGGPAAPTPGSTCTTQCGSDSTTVAVLTNSDLSITKTDGTSSITASSGSTTYTIRVTNGGPATVTGAVLKDVAPTNMTFTGVACSTAYSNTCTTAPSATQLSSGFALPALSSGAFYEITVAASTTLTSGSVANTATVTAPSGITDTNTANNSATDTDTVAAVSTTQPNKNVSSFPAVCDVVDWANSPITGTNVGQTGTKTFNSRNGLGLSVNLVPATSSGNGIVGLNTGFTNYGSWYEVRAVSTSLSPNNTAPAYGGAFVTRAGGDAQTNTVTITFPHPVINVRFGITDLDAIALSATADQGDWIRMTASYGGTTFNPDTLIAGGHALTVKGYNTSGATAPGTAASGASMTVPVPGRGTSTMGAGSNPNSYNTLMGTDIASGAQVTDPDGGTAVNRQGQGVAYFKGPLTTLTIVTGSKSPSSSHAIAFGNIDFCSPSIAVSKAVGTPTLQNDGSHNIPYTLTYRNTSYNQGLFPDATVRDNPFQPSFATPSGLDPWADIKPQLSDNVVPQILANSNIQSATVTGSPKITFANAAGTRNLDNTDANPSFDGTATNPTLMTGNTDARVSVGGSFDARFTVNAVIKSGVTAPQTVNNQATATGSFNTATATLNATSATVSATLTPAVKLTLSKVVDQKFVRYLGDPASPNSAELNYTIRVTNPNTVTAASGVVVTDTLPSQVSYVSSSPAASVSGQTLTWNVGTVAAGGSATVTVKVQVPTATAVAAAQPQATWTNTASVSGSNTTPASASASTDTVYTTLFKQVHNLGTNPPAEVPQLAPAWSSSGQGLPGEVLEYCIDFHNYGSTALANYVISDKVPDNTTIIGESWVLRSGLMDSPDRTPYTGGSVTYAAPVVRGTIDSLAPGSQGSMCFRVRIN